jgi:ADP-ribosylglycohydrolase
MRSAPFALISGDGADLAVDSSRTTHAHPSVLGSVRVYVWILQSLLDGGQIDVEVIEDVAGADLGLHPSLEPVDIPWAGIGHAIYALDLAKWAATKAADFPGAMESINRLGGDTDTNGAICGAVLAARFGFPGELVADLDHGRLVELQELASKLVAIDASVLEHR